MGVMDQIATGYGPPPSRVRWWDAASLRVGPSTGASPYTQLGQPGPCDAEQAYDFIRSLRDMLLALRLADAKYRVVEVDGKVILQVLGEP